MFLPPWGATAGLIRGDHGVDQLTATALAVALVVNLVVLVLALAWARRQREDPGAQGGVAAVGANGSARGGPWWAGRAEGSDAFRDAASAARDERAVRGAGGTTNGEVANGPSAGDAGTADAMSGPDAVTAPGATIRAAELLASLESAAGWRGMLTLEAARVTRYGRAATVVLAELEGVDRLASRLGPESLDRLLPAIAGTLRREARASDRIARLGTARFGLLLPETDEIAAINFVERVREATDLWLDASAVSLRLAFGWAELAGDGEVESVLELARERLDGERRGGRPNPRAEQAARHDRPTERPNARRRPIARDVDGPLSGPSSSPLAAS